MCLPLAAAAGAAGLGSAAAGAGTLLSVITPILGGIQQNKQAKAQAKAIEQEQNQRSTLTAIQQAQVAERQRQERAEEDFQIAASGLSGIGSSANLQRANDRDRSRDILNLAFQDSQERIRSQFQADQIRQRGRNARTSGFINAGTSFFRAAAGQASSPTTVGPSIFNSLFG